MNDEETPKNLHELTKTYSFRPNYRAQKEDDFLKINRHTKNMIGRPVVTLPGTSCSYKGVNRTLLERCTTRSYADKKLKPIVLSEIIRYSIGKRGGGDGNVYTRVYPSAGGLYSIENYIGIFNVEDIDDGIYYYNFCDHTLHLQKKGDFREEVKGYCFNQTFISDINLIFFHSIHFDKTTKYQRRAYRYSLIESGHISQNIYLTSDNLDLGCVSVGGFLDDEINTLLGINGISEAVCYLTCVGVPCE